MRRTLAAALFLAAAAIIAAAVFKKAASHPIDVYDNFDAPPLSKLWETDRFVPSALEFQSATVRAGHGAIKLTVHSNDKFEAGINGNADSERDELLEARSLTSKEETAYEHSWSMYLPSDFPIVPVRLVIAQWKQYCGSDTAPCSDDSPVLAVRYIGGVLRITQDLSHKQTVLYEEKADLRNRWLDLRFQVRFSPTSSGRVKAWLREDGPGDGQKNGTEQQVIDYRGITANPEDASTGYAKPSHFYFKMGLYRNVMPQPMTIYLDEYRKRELRPGGL